MNKRYFFFSLFFIYAMGAAVEKFTGIPTLLAGMFFWQFNDALFRKNIVINRSRVAVWIAALPVALLLGPVFDAQIELLKELRLAELQHKPIDEFSQFAAKALLMLALVPQLLLAAAHVASAYPAELKSWWQSLLKKRDIVLVFGGAEIAAIVVALTVRQKFFTLLTFVVVFFFLRYILKSSARLRTSTIVVLVLLIPFALFYFPSVQAHLDRVEELRMRIDAGEVDLQEELKDEMINGWWAPCSIVLLAGCLMALKRRSVQQRLYGRWAPWLIDREIEQEAKSSVPAS